MGYWNRRIGRGQGMTKWHQREQNPAKQLRRMRGVTEAGQSFIDLVHMTAAVISLFFVQVH